MSDSEIAWEPNGEPATGCACGFIHRLGTLQMGLMRRRIDRPWRAATVAAMCGLSACGGSPAGPSLANVEVSNVRLQATEGNASVCCCRVAAVARNRNTVPVHVTVKFFGYDADPTVPLSAVVYFVREMPPDSQRNLVASGFLFACSRIKDVKVDVDVTGLGTAAR
jgi:hypothetical protein